MDGKSAGIKAKTKIKNGKGQQIVVGMSGGVDSTATLILLKKNGWDPIGVSLKFPTWENKIKDKNLSEEVRGKNPTEENAKSALSSIERAKKICEKYGCEHYILDVVEDFQKNVIKYTINSLKNSQTPNPCVFCNRNTKFFHLFKFADSKNIKYFSTGHYAKITKSRKYKCFFLSVPKDKNKDQTYYLNLLPQEWLERIIFPLGEFTKKEVYEILKNENIDFYNKVRQSQDFCFIPPKKMDNFLEKEVGNKSGNIIDTKGKILGKHEGLQYYTIGQRKKIGLPGGPYYVIQKNSIDNSIVVSKNRSDVGKSEAKLSDVFFSTDNFYGKKLEVKAKIRYQSKSIPAQIIPVKGNSKTCIIKFKDPQSAVTPGQYCVFYIGKLCIGSGVIN
ncbi:MAG TPA: tRNA 2-thiouridine(34) synthase MnmA [bacterium]|jgi:tRNA-specific 2-thiouridylase|nr:tRNA 2-thiouridine(34) synthase MnmA [bacterium]